MDIYEDTWLSQTLGRAAYRVELTGTENAWEVSKHAASQQAAIYYAKIETARVGAVRQLLLAGFFVVDVNVTFVMEAKHCDPSRAEGEIQVGEFADAQRDKVLDIAGSSFRYSRFHLDPLIDDSLAHRIKREWINNYITGSRGESLLIASIGDVPAGFLAVIGSEANGLRTRTIDLMAVANPFRARGVGKALVAAFINRYRDQGDLLTVGTQAANIPSMRLYEKFGFTIMKTAYVVHLHVSDGMPVSYANR
jgi:GNAT superfamily N-acetyltransferase